MSWLNAARPPSRGTQREATSLAGARTMSDKTQKKTREEHRAELSRFVPEGEDAILVVYPGRKQELLAHLQVDHVLDAIACWKEMSSRAERRGTLASVEKALRA